MSLRDRVLEFLRATPPDRPLTRSRIAAELGLGPKERRPLRGVLDRLESEGRLSVSRARYSARREPAEGLGTFHATRQSYGFVTPDGSAVGERDLFVPPHAVGGALDGDRVRVRALPRAPGDRGPEGEVLAVVARSPRAVVGVVRGGLLFPLGAGGNPVALPRGAGREGRVALVQLEPGEGTPSAREVSVLGDFRDAATALRAAEVRFGLTHAFPEAVRTEAEGLPEKPSREDFAGRADLRELTAVTVDPEDARDFDDALSAHREGPAWRLWVHIADVGHYVRPGSATDREALRRGNTTYLPSTAYHMLPERLSAGLCSLLPERDRLAFTAELEVGAGGELLGARFHKSVMRSARRLAYGEAQEILDRGAGAAPEVLALLGELKGLARVLQARREARGALDLELPEVHLRLGPSGEVEELVPEPRLETHRIVEECMLLCNQAVAEALSGAGAPALYRVHEPPDPLRLEPLRPLLVALGLGDSARGELAEPAVLQRVLEKARGHRAEKLVSYLVLRGMAQARYSADLAGHFGLALERYTHFTSPIRRYPDLLVHRALAAMLGLGPPPGTDLRSAAAHCSETERLADEAEREVVRWLELGWLARRLGDEFDALVLGFGRGVARVELLDHLVEGVCPFRLVEDDRLRLDPDGMKVRGVYSGAVLRVGDPLKVRLVRVDQTALEAQFAPVGWPPEGPPRRGRRPRR